MVTEGDKHCVTMFSPSGKKLRSFGAQGSLPGQFLYPCGVAVDSKGNILVADVSNHRIQKFTAEGKFIAEKRIKIHGSLQALSPCSVACNPNNGKVYVGTMNHNIQILNSDLTFVRDFGIRGTGRGAFYYPEQVAFDSHGNVYVADRDNHRIQVFTAHGKFLRMFGKFGRNKGELAAPHGIVIDSSDTIFISERDNHRISVFTTDGEFVRSFGNEGCELGELKKPRRLAMDSNGVIYVCDLDNNRVQMFFDQATPKDESKASESEEEFIRRINEAFKCGEKIARRLAHAMLVGPPGSGKSSLMYRLLRRKRRKLATSTDVAEGIVTVEVKLNEKQSTFHAAVVVDGEWNEFEFNDSLFSHMSFKSISQPTQRVAQVPPPNDFPGAGKKGAQPPSLSERSIEPIPSASSIISKFEIATGLRPAPPQLAQSMISYLRKKHGSYKEFKKFLEKGFSLYLRDTGGQVEFQEILPLLIFGPSIFLFVFRIDIAFEEKFEVKYTQENGVFNDYTSSITIEEALLQCLATVDVIKKTDKTSIETRDPFVFIVGTHKDELKKKFKNSPSFEDEIRKFNLRLDALLKNHGFNNLVSYAGNDSEHVMYTVDNTSDEEEDFDLIRSRMNAVVTSRSEFVIHYPINYLLFCFDLQQVKDNIILLQDFKDRARKFGIEGDKEVSKLLHFLCSRIGIIQHFDKDGIRHIVINQPQFLYKKVSHLVIETFNGRALTAEERVNLEKGILSLKAAESIIGSESKISAAELLDLLVHLRIIARFKDGKFFIPSVLNHLPEADDALKLKAHNVVAPLYIHFGCKYCPKGLFAVLVTYLMSPSEDTSLTFEFNEQSVHKDQVSFNVESSDDILDVLTLRIIGCSFLEVSIVPDKRDGSLIADMCNIIRNLITTFLDKSFEDLHYNEKSVKYELCLNCEHCNEHHRVLSTKMLRCISAGEKIPIPLKGSYWFEEFDGKQLIS